MRKVPLLFLFLLLFSDTFGKTAVYRAYYSFFPIGKITFNWDNDRIEVHGEVYPYLKSFYNYDFKFVAQDNDFFLYEHENSKVRVYKGEKLYKKKPWLPLIVQFLKTRKAKINSDFPYRVKKEGNKYIVYPLKSKKVKKIEVVFGKSDFPEYIRIYGKHYIKMKKIEER